MDLDIGQPRLATTRPSVLVEGRRACGDQGGSRNPRGPVNGRRRRRRDRSRRRLFASSGAAKPGIRGGEPRPRARCSSTWPGRNSCEAHAGDLEIPPAVVAAPDGRRTASRHRRRIPDGAAPPRKTSSQARMTATVRRSPSRPRSIQGRRRRPRRSRLRTSSTVAAGIERRAPKTGRRHPDLRKGTDPTALAQGPPAHARTSLWTVSVLTQRPAELVWAE